MISWKVLDEVISVGFIQFLSVVLLNAAWQL